MRYFSLMPTADALNEAYRILRDLRAFLPQGKGNSNHYETVLLEAVANAVQANERNNGERIVIGLFMSQQRVTIMIGDEGGGFDPKLHMEKPMPDPWATSGRGIPLIRHLSHEVRYRQRRGRKAGMWLVVRWDRE